MRPADAEDIACCSPLPVTYQRLVMKSEAQARMASIHSLDSRIVIIGCGISGIGAAQKLIKNGFRNVRIIEATARSGGRICTGRMGE